MKENERIWKNIISLGSFCSPAMELQRISIRVTSMPFDWLIAPQFENVIKLLKNGFEDFLNPKYMFQLKDYPQYYRNTKYNIDFYHDFDPYKSFDVQIEGVSLKYKRRIDRLYSYIKEPTLFIRYITSQKDATYISNNYEEILEFLKSFNKENDIIFVTNEGINCDNANMKITYVEIDDGDTVARKFLLKAPELEQFILNHVAIKPGEKKKSKSSEMRHTIKKIYYKLRKNRGVYRHWQSI